jgi:hypothetical protein
MLVGVGAKGLANGEQTLVSAPTNIRRVYSQQNACLPLAAVEQLPSLRSILGMSPCRYILYTIGGVARMPPPRIV